MRCACSSLLVLACLYSSLYGAQAVRPMNRAAGAAEGSLVGAWKTESGSRRLLQAPNPSQNVIEMMLAALGAPQSFYDQFAFAKLQSAFLVQEYITIIDTVVSLNTFTDPSTNTTTVVPGQVYWDLGSGLTLEAGVSALLYVNSVANLNGTIPQAGVNIFVDNIEGKVNIPARRRLQTAAAEPAAADRRTLLSAEVPAADEAVKGVPRKLHQTLSAADIGGLTANGFWESLSSVLPPALMQNLTQLLEASARPVSEFLARSNTTEEELRAAIAQYGDGNLTVTEPQKLPLIPQITVIPCLDIEFSFTLLAQPNQAGANVRVTPFATRFLGQSVFQSVKVAPFLSAFAGVPNVPYTLAGQASQALNATAALLDNGDTQPLSDFVMAEAALVKAQLSPIPIVWTIEFDILIRAQVQVNGGDIALVL